MALQQVLVTPRRIRKPGREESVSALSVAQWFQYAAMVIVWLLTVAYFTSFWFSVPRVDSWLLYIPITIALFYESVVVVSCYLFFLGHMRVPKHIPAPQGLKVAIISPCVPSQESIEIIERQLRSLVEVTYPHDSWILDEEDDPQVAALCRQYGVRHFSRKGIAKWNQPHPPFQAKTKAGNVNAWLFEYGVEYDLFVQMDIDHNPVPHYLDRTLGHFQDDRVAWVQAPSVNGNLSGLAARGSSEQSRLLHGPLQMGLYGFCHTPMIIGSHTTYRTSAMLAIGGMQPTRAEDHLDTVVFTQHGYVGVFLPELIATGDGPENFETYLAQEFAWAYSMAQILFQYSYKNFRRYPLRTIPAFLFTQSWYPLWSFSLLTLFITPPLMLLLDRSSAAISLVDFMWYYVPLQLCATGICWWSSRWFQPAGLGIGWRCLILNVARWPVLCWAIIQALLKIKKPYMITPKGLSSRHIPRFNLRAQRPYIAFIAISLGSVWWYLLVHGRSATQGYLLYVLMGALFMLAVFWTAMVQDLKQLRRQKVTQLQAVRARLHPLALGIGLLLLVGYTSWVATPRMLETARWRGDAASASAALPPQSHAAAVATVPVTGIPGAAAQGSPASMSSTTPIVELCSPRREPIALPTPLFGAYDPRQQLLDEGFQVDAIYTGLYAADLSALPARLENIYAGNRIPMITIEPWPLNEPGLKADDVLGDIVAGHYDTQLQSLAATLNKCAGQAFIRFGQEMEISELYPWYSQQPERYIAAYRYVYRMLSAQATTEMTWIWSPAGNFTADLYYPGADVVDYVGFTLLGSHDFDRLSGALLRRSFEQLMDEKHRRMQQFGKPLIVAELGVSGSSELQVDWLRAMFASLDKYPDVHGLMYYNDYNAINRLVANPPDYKITTRQWRESGDRGELANPLPTPSPIPVMPITPPAGTPTATLEE